MYVVTYESNKGPGVGVGSGPAGAPCLRGCDSGSVLIPPVQAHKDPSPVPTTTEPHQAHLH